MVDHTRPARRSLRSRRGSNCRRCRRQKTTPASAVRQSYSGRGLDRKGSIVSVIEVVAQLSRSCGMAQLSEGLGLDLTDPFARDAEFAADLFQRPLASIFEAKAQLQYSPL